MEIMELQAQVITDMSRSDHISASAISPFLFCRCRVELAGLLNVSVIVNRLIQIMLLFFIHL